MAVRSWIQQRCKRGPRPQPLVAYEATTRRRWGPKHWGVTRTQMLNLLEDARSNPDETVREFVDRVVKPRTANTGMGLSLLLNRERPKRVNLMVSHAWDENALSFFFDVTESMHARENVFVCFLALYQGTSEDIKEQLGHDVLKGPFAQVIDCCKNGRGRMLVVPNEELRGNGQGLYSRMWCDLEVYYAIRNNCHIQFTSRTTPEHLFGHNVSLFSSRNARCGNPSLPTNEDEKAIREVIESKHVASPEQRQSMYLTWYLLSWWLWTLVCSWIWMFSLRHSLIIKILVSKPKLVLEQSVGHQVSILFLVVAPSVLLLRLLLRVLFGRLFGRKDGYSDLDDVITAAAEFNRAFPGARLDPRRWDIAMPAARPLRAVQDALRADRERTGRAEHSTKSLGSDAGRACPWRAGAVTLLRLSKLGLVVFAYVCLLPRQSPWDACYGYFVGGPMGCSCGIALLHLLEKVVFGGGVSKLLLAVEIALPLAVLLGGVAGCSITDPTTYGLYPKTTAVYPLLAATIAILILAPMVAATTAGHVRRRFTAGAVRPGRRDARSSQQLEAPQWGAPLMSEPVA